MLVTRQAGGEHVNVVGMDDQHVLGLQGVGDCACDQAGRELNMSLLMVLMVNKFMGNRGLVTVLVSREEMNMVDEGISG